MSRRRLLALPAALVARPAAAPAADRDLLTLVGDAARGDLRARGLEPIAAQYESIATAARRLRTIDLGEVAPMAVTVVDNGR